MYFDQPEDGLDGPISFEMKSIIGIMGVVILLFIFLPGRCSPALKRQVQRSYQANDTLCPIKCNYRRA